MDGSRRGFLLRDSRSACARAASFSAYSWSMRIFTLPDFTILNRSFAVASKSLRVATPAHPKVNPGEPGHVGSPSPGVITNVFVQLNQKAGRGEKLLMLEAMKMQSTIYAPMAGRVSQLLVEPGQRVEAKDLLVVIEA